MTPPPQLAMYKVATKYSESNNFPGFYYTFSDSTILGAYSGD